MGCREVVARHNADKKRYITDTSECNNPWEGTLPQTTFLSIPNTDKFYSPLAMGRRELFQPLWIEADTGLRQWLYAHVLTSVSSRIQILVKGKGSLAPSSTKGQGQSSAIQHRWSCTIHSHTCSALSTTPCQHEAMGLDASQHCTGLLQSRCSIPSV